MLRSILLSLFILSSSASFAQSDDPVAVVQTQLDTYNAQDLDGFSKVFSEDVEIFMNLGDTAATIVGREALRERYGAMFEKNPENKSTLIGRMVQGNYVFDHEWITGNGREFKIVAIYEVNEGLIQRAWFAR